MKLNLACTAVWLLASYLCLAQDDVTAEEKRQHAVVRRYIIACIDERFSLSREQRATFPVSTDFRVPTGENREELLSGPMWEVWPAISEPESAFALDLTAQVRNELRPEQDALVQHPAIMIHSLKREGLDAFRASARERIIQDVKAGKFERSKLAQLLNGLDIRITESIERAMETASDETHAIYRFLLKRTQEEEAAGKISQEEAEQERDQHRTRMFGELAVNLLRVSDAMREMQAIEADLRRGQIGDQDAKLKIAELQRQLDPRIQHRHESADYLKKRFLAHRLQLGPLGTEAAKQLSKIEEQRVQQILDGMVQSEPTLADPADPSAKQLDSLQKVKALHANGQISQAESEIRTKAVLILPQKTRTTGMVRQLRQYDPSTDSVYEQAVAPLMTQHARTAYQKWKESRLLYRESATRDVVEILIQAELKLTESQAGPIGDRIRKLPVLASRANALQTQNYPTPALQLLDKVVQSIDLKSLTEGQKKRVLFLDWYIAEARKGVDQI